MTGPNLLVEDRGGVRIITLNRPEKLNAFDEALWFAARDALAGAADDADVACVVITGAGRAFTAGVDLSSMADTITIGDEPGFVAFIKVAESFPKPLLAAVNGVGVGIGITLLLHCDIVLIAEGARLKTPFVSLGVTTEASASLLLPARIGWQDAAYHLFTEEWIASDRAVELRLALRECPPETLLDETLAIAARISTMPVRSLVETKKLMLAARSDAVAAARERELAVFAQLVGSPDNQAALEQFFDR